MRRQLFFMLTTLMSLAAVAQQDLNITRKDTNNIQRPQVEVAWD